jgi:hypothetical protein
MLSQLSYTPTSGMRRIFLPTLSVFIWPLRRGQHFSAHHLHRPADSALHPRCEHPAHGCARHLEVGLDGPARHPRRDESPLGRASRSSVSDPSEADAFPCARAPASPLARDFDALARQQCAAVSPQHRTAPLRLPSRPHPACDRPRQESTHELNLQQGRHHLAHLWLLCLAVRVPNPLQVRDKRR